VRTDTAFAERCFIRSKWFSKKSSSKILAEGQVVSCFPWLNWWD